MDIWMKGCRKEATCYWCKHPILNKTYMVVGQYYRGKWKIQRKWHPDCWIEQAIDALSKREVIEHRGKKRSELSDVDKAARFGLLARHASAVQRIRQHTAEHRLDKVVKAGELLVRIEKEIEQYGGVPKSWKKGAVQNDTQV